MERILYRCHKLDVHAMIWLIPTSPLPNAMSSEMYNAAYSTRVAKKKSKSQPVMLSSMGCPEVGISFRPVIVSTPACRSRNTSSCWMFGEKQGMIGNLWERVIREEFSA